MDFYLLNKYHVSMIPYILEKLKNTMDGDPHLPDARRRPDADGNAGTQGPAPVFYRRLPTSTVIYRLLTTIFVGLVLTVPTRARAQQPADINTPRPIEALNSVWIEEMTWMEVRDAIASGKTTVIIATGGIEQNGPYLATGKHNYVLMGACEMLARRLGNALCAPIIKLVPEGNIDEPSGHMRYPGTISLRQETFEAMLTDVGASLEAHGFEHIIYIGDSGRNQRGMAAVAARLNERWGRPVAHHVPEYYDKPAVVEWMAEELGIVQPTDDGLHDNYVITSEIMITDPDMVRYDQRVAAGLATINGLSIVPKEKTIEMGKKLLGYRVDRTIEAINAAIAGSR